MRLCLFVLAAFILFSTPAFAATNTTYTGFRTGSARSTRGITGR